MYKINLPVTRCLPGMITAEPVIDLNTGLTIIGADQVMTDVLIHKLSHFSFNQICVYVGSWNNIWNVAPEVLEKYEKNRKQLKSLLDSYAVTKVLDLEALEEMTHHLQVDFKKNYTILACINMIRLTDEYTYTHSMNVALLSMLMGRWLNYDEETVKTLILLGLVHDIENNKPNESLAPTSKLKDDEFKHLINCITYSYEVLFKVRQKHLNILTGNEEKKLRNVLLVADIYDTLTAHRIYREAQSPFEILELMQSGALGQLDPETLFTFINHIANYYIGVYVILNSGEVGEVVFIHPFCVYKPIVRIGETYVDLYVQSHVKIIQIA